MDQDVEYTLQILASHVMDVSERVTGMFGHMYADQDLSTLARRILEIDFNGPELTTGFLVDGLYRRAVIGLLGTAYEGGDREELDRASGELTSNVLACAIAADESTISVLGSNPNLDILGFLASAASFNRRMRDGDPDRDLTDHLKSMQDFLRPRVDGAGELTVTPDDFPKFQEDLRLLCQLITVNEMDKVRLPDERDMVKDTTRKSRPRKPRNPDGTTWSMD